MSDPSDLAAARDLYLPVIEAALRRLDCPGKEMPAAIEPGQYLAADLGLSSLEIMKLALALEETLDITVEEGAEFDIETVDDLCQKLDQWVAARHGQTALTPRGRA